MFVVAITDRQHPFANKLW